MINEYYKFKDNDVFEFARTVNIDNRINGDQLEFVVCPYCHGGKGKDKKTFAISLRTGQFECKRASCGVKGNMITLAKDFKDKGFSLGKDVDAYYNIDDARNNFKRFKDAHRKLEVRDNAIKYLASRGISEEICRKYEITTQKDNDKIIVFPFKDEDGALQFIKYRNTEPKEGQSKEWCVAGNYKKILFGMNQCEDFETLVITEGQIDSLSLAEAGVKNAVSVPTGKNGFTWKPNVWDWLVKFNEIVVFGDCERGEITLAKEITQFFPKRVRVVRIEDYHGCKDANELLNMKDGKTLIHRAIENAEVKVSFRIKKLTDVESVDLSKMKAYPTMISELDAMIGKGFHEGEVIILTGKCGEGKSTLASQLVARMVQNGLKCFCYSGELPDYMFKAWIDSQIFGTRELKKAELNKINEWYKDRIYIYDNSSVIDENEELFEVMEQAIKDLGCKYVLIDNLMTAMEDKPGEDLFRQQSNFLKRLSQFAKGFNVIVMLVAHPKKGNDNSNDSISGSGDITNRANLVLRFQRKKEKNGMVLPDSNESVLMVTKNRTTGKLNTEGIPLFYDDRNMRLSEKGIVFTEFMEQEAPEMESFEPIQEEMEIPFL